VAAEVQNGVGAEFRPTATGAFHVVLDEGLSRSFALLRHQRQMSPVTHMAELHVIDEPAGPVPGESHARGVAAPV
jgi:hypothetical protein